MKIITLDQFEFTNTETEEFLVIALAKTTQYKNLPAFYNATLQETHFNIEPVPNWLSVISFENYSYRLHTTAYLKDFMDYQPSPNAKVIELCTVWNEQDLLIEESNTFIRYYWHTSA